MVAQAAFMFWNRQTNPERDRPEIGVLMLGIGLTLLPCLVAAVTFSK
jgi:hypothetical protein